MNVSDIELVTQLSDLCIKRGLTISTAESCTGGGIGHWLTSLSGSSAWYLGGYIVYSNQAKVRDLSVSESTLDNYGAVSEQVAAQMAVGAARKTQTNIAISVTGIAGPRGGTKEKPVGTVCFGWAYHKEIFGLSSAEKSSAEDYQIQTQSFLFEGNREEVRYRSMQKALELCVDQLQKLSIRD